MKTLADFKRDLAVGRRVRLIYRNGQELNSLREVAKTTTTAIKFNALDETKAGWLDYPKASLVEYDGKTAKIYTAGYRGLTEEEKRVIANEPRDDEQDKIDMMTDGSTMFYRRKRYYMESDMFYLFSTKKQQGKRLTQRDGKKVIEDDGIKGNLILVYKIEDEGH